MELEMIQKTLQALGMTGVAAILLYFLLKSLPDFLVKIQALGNSNAAQITDAITKQTDKTADFNERLARAIEENTHAVNSLRESRRDDIQKIEQTLDHVRGIYRMVENMTQNRNATNNGP